MSELTLHTSKAKSLLLLLASVLFTVAGVFLARDGELMGHVAYAFFGLCSVAYMVQLTTGGGYLKLRDDEFEFVFGFPGTMSPQRDQLDGTTNKVSTSPNLAE